MGKVETLMRIEQELAEGKLGIARDRLHGLMLSYPDDMSIRSGLGDVYFKLGYPIEAGRCWFLEDAPSDEKLAAIASFVKDCKGDPSTILKRLKVRGQPDKLSEKAAREKVQALIEECKTRGLEVPAFQKQKSSILATPNLIGCWVVFGLVILFTLIGVGATIYWAMNH